MAFMGDWKVISKAPHFDRLRKENDKPNPSIDMTSLPGPLAHVHEHIAGIERALFDEVERRITSENQFREQLESKIRITTEKLSDSSETEMARMYRRIEADVMNRMESLAIEVRKISTSMTKLSRQIESIAWESHENRDRIHRIEKRFGLLIEGNDVCASSHTKDVNSLRDSAKTEVEMAKRVNDLTDVVSSRVITRIDAIEEWLQGNLTPEILRIVDSVRAEQLKREEHDQEIMDVVRQYSEIMRKHFDAEDHVPKLEDPSPGPNLQISPGDLINSLQPTPTQITSFKPISRRPSVHDQTVASEHASGHQSARELSESTTQQSGPKKGDPSSQSPVNTVRGFLRRVGRRELDDAIHESN